MIHISDLHFSVSSFILVVYPSEHPNGMFRWVHHKIETLQKVSIEYQILLSRMLNKVSGWTLLGVGEMDEVTY
jgi:hypothetical protein